MSALDETTGSTLSREMVEFQTGVVRGGYSGYGCGCNPSYGQSCPDCDGTNLRKQARIPEALPPCMTPGYDPAAHQRIYERWAAGWRARLGIPTPTDDEGDVA